MRTADVVDLVDSSPFENGENSSTIIFHVQPVALLFAVAIDRKGFVVERIRDHKREEFFGKLVGTVIVRGASDQSGKFVRANVGAYQEVRASLGSGIGTAWLERRIFAGVGSRSDISIDFVGGNVNEALYADPSSHLHEIPPPRDAAFY